MEEISAPSPPPFIKADAAAPPTVTKVQFDFFNDCGVSELAQKINLDLSGTSKPFEKSRKEPIKADTNNNQKEAIKTATTSKSISRKEQLLVKLKLLEKENALRHQLLYQQAALERSQHALKLSQQRTKLYTCHKFKLGPILSGNQPFIADAKAEVAERRQQQSFAAESSRHLSLLASLERLAPNARYINQRLVPVPPPSPKPQPPSNRSLWNQNKPSWFPAPLPFKLESFSAPRTRVVHVHHHHYPDSVHDSSEDEYVEAEYEEDEDVEDKYVEDEYEEEEYEEDNDEEAEFSNYDSEFGEIESNYLLTTSCDDDSSYSGYDE